MQTIDLAQFKSLVNSHEYFIIDKVLLEKYSFLTDALKGKKTFCVENPETSKSIEVFEQVCLYLLENGITRDDHLQVIGGGATSDLGGYVAASILRGIKWSVYPSTLLAMVDAAIGGKVGINTRLGKNLIGSFHFPEMINFYFPFLETLEQKEINSGQGEILKYKYLYPEMRKSETLQELVLNCAKFKSAITENDFKELNQRKILNLGHTFGHALEKSSSKTHGECVAWGLKLIIDLYQSELSSKIEQDLGEIGFLHFGEQVNFERFVGFLKRDKKLKLENQIDLIIPELQGGARIQNIDMDKLIKDIESYEHYSRFFK